MLRYLKYVETVYANKIDKFNKIDIINLKSRIIDFNLQRISLLIFIDFWYNLLISIDCYQLPSIIGFIDCTRRAICMKHHTNRQNVSAWCPFMQYRT